MPKRRNKEQTANHERWLVSYADFITLLFAFFVVMYGMSAVDAKKMQRVAQSFQQAFNAIGTGGIGTLPIIDADLAQDLSELPAIHPDSGVGPSLTPQSEYAQLRVLEQTIHASLQASLSNAELIEMIHIYLDEQGLVISLSAKYFFDSGKAILRPEVLPIIDQIASVLKPLHRELRIEGHTDDLPIQTAAYPSNWELSAARATYVIKYFVERFGFSPKLLSAVGYGEFRPVASNTTEEGRARNRRVDIVVLSHRILSHLPIQPADPIDSQL